jgi:ribosome recycling factor
MAYTFTELQNKLNEIEAWLKKELSSIRTGRATVTILDTVIVEVYGAKSPLNQNANITIEDPKTIRVAPWDKSLITEIEKGIALADLGVSTAVDDEGMRIIFPDLTTETREKLVKKAKNKIEESKVSIRKIPLPQAKSKIFVSETLSRPLSVKSSFIMVLLSKS